MQNSALRVCRSAANKLFMTKFQSLKFQLRSRQFYVIVSHTRVNRNCANFKWLLTMKSVVASIKCALRAIYYIIFLAIKITFNACIYIMKWSFFNRILFKIYNAAMYTQILSFKMLPIVKCKSWREAKHGNAQGLCPQLNGPCTQKEINKLWIVSKWNSIWIVRRWKMNQIQPRFTLLWGADNLIVPYRMKLIRLSFSFQFQFV